jgi:hypothetical protein
MLCSEGVLQLDMNALQSLSIFNGKMVDYFVKSVVEHHPCKSMQIGVSKEGLSLFGILNKTTSVVGKEMLRLDH